MTLVQSLLRGDGRVDPLGLLCQLLRRRRGRGLVSGGTSTVTDVCRLATSLQDTGSKERQSSRLRQEALQQW